MCRVRLTAAREMDDGESCTRALSVPAHRTLAPARSCLKGSGAGGKAQPGAVGITIRETPEKRLISPRNETTRELFYTDEEYERFTREATSMAWLLESAVDEHVGPTHRPCAEIWHDEDAVPAPVAREERGSRTTPGYEVDCNENIAILEEKRLPHDAPQHGAHRAEQSHERRVPFGVSNRDTMPPAAQKGAQMPGEHAHKVTRLEREIESMNMHELKDKIKVSTSTCFAAPSAAVTARSCLALSGVCSHVPTRRATCARRRSPDAAGRERSPLGRIPAPCCRTGEPSGTALPSWRG